MLTKSFSTFFITLACLSLTACGAHYGAVKFVSDPPGAEVINLDDGTIIGNTPVTMFWKDGSSNRQHIPIRLKKQGYYEKVTSFWLSMRHSSEQEALENAQLVKVSMQKKGE
ncbi:hypothetical protein GCM10008090_19620 [Arenicella chitinivorans]|uniref:PEGA domain-containing protein n=1 Tax=Arenicella chitinivorans TaxID=1329800 RepID=A0A918RT13_9GAMM|nr:hypothetical protein [Arenicella chitinivorans]GHA10131.1 hypothetical protein GCM10008090_19620 [Arenicella chitinivorans]